MKPLAAVVPWSEREADRARFEALAHLPSIGALAVWLPPQAPPPALGATPLGTAELRSTEAVVAALRWFEASGAEALWWSLSPSAEPSEEGLGRLRAAARDHGAALAYGDFHERRADGTTALHPLIDYQRGSLRDDFDFGPGVLLARAQLAGLAETLAAEAAGLHGAGWYELRLRLSERGPVVHLPDPIGTLATGDDRPSGQRVFDYVDPHNREAQLEAERAATAHLRRIDAWLPPPVGEPLPDDGPFPLDASVIIPVRDRVRTIGEAVTSALSQRAPFAFNVIVVDNHSTDGTTELLAERTATDARLVHHVPVRRDLGIGGCWDEAIRLPICGRYAVQLDSDDLYSATDSLARLVGEFARGGPAMVIGAYTTVNFDLQPLPPGLVDHREWTADNGHNNALRVAGLGAPRAFHVPSLRAVGFPNVSYGEDYAVALRLCRDYRVGRIFDSLYWCRRWEGNSDSDLPLETSNRYQAYKDRLRTLELAARVARNSK